MRQAENFLWIFLALILVTKQQLNLNKVNYEY
jgi:hypothetical protein